VTKSEFDVDVIARSRSGRSLKIQEAPDQKNYPLEMINANLVSHKPDSEIRKSSTNRNDRLCALKKFYDGERNFLVPLDIDANILCSRTRPDTKTIWVFSP
jgi:hypothetical protein